MAIDRQPHMLVMPKAYLGLRIVQVIFSVVVLGICIYGAIYAPVSGIILNIFTALATIISLIYYFVGAHSQPFLYQYWAILSLDVFCLIFWLISFALLAAEVAVAAAYSCSGYYDYYGDYVSSGCSSGSSLAIGLFGACAGIGGIQFVLFIATLSLFGVALARHRKAGGHCVPGAIGTAAPQTANQDFGAEKAGVPYQGQAYAQAAAPAQPGYYPPQAADPRYAPVAQGGQQYQPVPQQMAPQQMPPQGVPQQYPEQHVPVQYAQQQAQQ